MNGRSHFLWSLGLSMWIMHYFFKTRVSLNIVISFLIAFLSWLPDIDIMMENKYSKEKNRSLFNRFMYIFTKTFLKHRTITHSIWIPVILIYFSEFYLSGYYLLKTFLRIVYMSLLLHIFEDTFTVMGVRLFYPLNINFRLFRFRTNSYSHSCVLNITAVIIISLFIYFYV